MKNIVVKAITVMLVLVMVSAGTVEAARIIIGESVDEFERVLPSRRQYKPEQEVAGPETEQPEEAKAELKAVEHPYSDEDIELLARLVHAEAEGESFVGKVAVAASILSRVESDDFPNTIPGVVYQIESGRYQYSPVLDGRINQPAGEEARRAVEAALQGQDPSGGATGFYNPAKTANWWVRTRPVTTVIGKHVFFR